jgi:hypothetical protein
MSLFSGKLSTIIIFSLKSPVLQKPFLKSLIPLVIPLLCDSNKLRKKKGNCVF